MQAIGDKLGLMNMIEFINKYYATWSMVKLEDLVGCMIKHDMTKMTLNISQPDLNKKITQEFNKDLKSLMTSNTPDTIHKKNVYSQEMDSKIS